MFIDARTMSKAEREQACETAGAKFLLGAPCTKAGHRLRTKKGHCIQCDTSKIAYQLRNSEPGIVYIAGSRKLRVIKIGSTEDIEDRIKQANAQHYGGTGDWQYLFEVPVEEMGRVENRAKRILSQSRADGEYEKDGRTQKATEMFSVGFGTAYAAVLTAIKETGVAFDLSSARESPQSKDF